MENVSGLHWRSLVAISGLDFLIFAQTDRKWFRLFRLYPGCLFHALVKVHPCTHVTNQPYAYILVPNGNHQIIQLSDAAVKTDHSHLSS